MLFTVHHSLFLYRDVVFLGQYEGCLSYFGTREQNQILIIENFFLLFLKIFPIKMYLDAFEPIVEVLLSL